MNEHEGRLVLASNSIGPLGHVPPESLEFLRSAELVVFEEARGGRQALKAAGIHRDFLLYSEHGQEDTLAEVRQVLRSGGTVVYMSDQGSPGLADPGRALARVAFELKMELKVIPGPSSLTAAISACPFPTHSFWYGGFPPRDRTERSEFISSVVNRHECVALMDAPYRLGSLIDALIDAENMQKKRRKYLLALDISGPNEQYFYGNAIELKKQIPEGKHNFVLIMEG